MNVKNFLLIIVLISGVGLFFTVSYSDDPAKKADIVIFSFDRPMQLYALLESLQLYVTGLGDKTVIYRASSESFAQAYNRVSAAFTQINFVRQSDNPAADFKPLTLQAVFGSPHPYIIFAVDDIIVKDYVSLADCIQVLEHTRSYGFYLRMGKNLTECYSESCKQLLPPFKQVAPGIFLWHFANGRSDWHYPHSVDMTLYRKCDIEWDLKILDYRSPNALETNWAGRGGAIMHRAGLCYAHTKIVNVPLNRVQDVWNNRHMHSYSPVQLLEIFNNGMKIDIKPLYRVANKAAHMEYTPTFITR